MSNKELPPTDPAITAGYDLFGWYWQPEGAWQKSEEAVLAGTREAVALDQTKSDLQSLCDRVQGQLSAQAQQMEKILERLKQ